MLGLIIYGFTIHCHHIVYGGSSIVGFISRRIPMLPVANVDGVTYLTAVSACFPSASVLVPSFVIKRHTMLLVANAFRVTDS